MSILGIMQKQLTAIGIPYEFMRWTSASTPSTHWIGEYVETPTDTEDGYKEGTFILTGTFTGSWLELETQRAKIEDHFPRIGGLRIHTDDGTVVIFYANASHIDTGEANLKRIQINLEIKIWKGIK